ncbi:MAG: sigma-70 family RNA polymerase sigma factor [Acidobacteria bacterium]|nr:sigma-70 family RNA polymerase sigma factor [Acidobacteriota bacterium]
MELVSFCRALLWKKADLEDALQEVLLQAVKAYHRFVPGTRFKSWLFQVATNTVFNLNRKSGACPPARREASAVDPAIELKLEDSYEAVLKDPARVVAALRSELRRAVEELNEIERTVLLLRSMCDLKYQEIAEALGIPLGSVMGNLGRARAKLRKALVEYSHEM